MSLFCETHIPHNMIHAWDASAINSLQTIVNPSANIPPRVQRKCHTMAVEGSSMMTSTHLDLSVSTDITMLGSVTPTSGVRTLGFIISLCMVEQCLTYDDDNIKAVYIYHNYTITKIPANALLGAAYLEVSWYPIQNYIMHTIFIKVMP